MSAADGYAAGVEGGATKSTIVLINLSDGAVVAQAIGEATNPWLRGMEPTIATLVEMVNDVKTQAGIDLDSPIFAVGLSMSGGEKGEQKEKLLAGLAKAAPNLATHIHICNDTIAPIVTACENGGVSLIAGTGSNCRLVKEDGAVHNAGGWGHMMGDEGAAYFIAHSAIKTVFDVEDGLVWHDQPPPPATDYVRERMNEYFGVTKLEDMLKHLYSDFNKTFFAGFCVEIAKGAADGDALCLDCFTKAGRYLGLHIKAIAPHLSDEMKSSPGGVRVVTTGSVFKSWQFLEEGFVSVVSAEPNAVSSLTLVELTAPCAIGAAVWAAGESGTTVPLDREAVTSVLF